MREPEAGDPWVKGRDVSNQWIHDSQYGHLHLRDFFAAFALAGLVANQGSPRTLGGDWLAAEAYHAADAMLARREK